MNTNHHSFVDPNTGNVSWRGSLSIEKGDHSHMPSRTSAYLPGYERGHVTASSLGGSNTPDNIVPQHYDLNHGAYYSMERGERSALQNGATIESSKTAVVNSQPGDMPAVFMVSDNVSYSDNHTESIHHSFTNASYAEQQAWNDQSAALPGTFDGQNPENKLANSMSSVEYAELMENTDAELPGISEDYAEADFSGVPGIDSAAFDIDTTVSDENAVASVDTDSDVYCDTDD